MSEKKIYYKYRSLDNWKFVLDIIVNSRLFAAPFLSLNDPMEGRYYYYGGEVENKLRQAIKNHKLRHNICSLSREKSNTLLWSYYASGHTGVAFGVREPQTPAGLTLQIHPVRYDQNVSITGVPGDLNKVVIDILSQKQIAWTHEKEVRVFTLDQFVKVELAELVFGLSTSKADRELVASVARKWHPNIKVTKIKRSELDKLPA